MNTKLTIHTQDEYAPFGYAESDYMPGLLSVPLPCDGQKYKISKDAESTKCVIHHSKEKKVEPSRFSRHLDGFVYVIPMGK